MVVGRREVLPEPEYDLVIGMIVCILSVVLHVLDVNGLNARQLDHHVLHTDEPQCLLGNQRQKASFECLYLVFHVVTHQQLSHFLHIHFLI